MKIFSKTKFKSGAGFTIIELVIAIFILSFSIFGVYNAFSTVIVLTHGASDRFIAAYLAQEGLEIIRNIRDNNWISGEGNWRRGLDICEDPGCEADYTTETDAPGSRSLTPWPVAEGGTFLRINDSGFYNYSYGPDSRFKRKIITTFLGDYIIKVSVSVTWVEKPTILNPSETSGVIEAEETLYDWY